MNINSKPVRVVAVLARIILGVIIYLSSNGLLLSFTQKVLGTVTLPFQKATSAVGKNFDEWADRNLRIDKIIEENEKLKQQIIELQKKQIDYDRIKLENDEYKKLFNSSQIRQDYEFAQANVIARDWSDKFYSFTIDKGKKDGIKNKDVVISSDGLVGIVIDCSERFSKVSTILSPGINVGALAGESREVCVVNGSTDMSKDGLCMAKYLSEQTNLKSGDIVFSSGYGTIFPQELLIGTVDSVEFDNSGNYKYATIKPSANIQDVKIVFVIKK
jgi:rod shape-determining protein MreC